MAGEPQTKTYQYYSIFSAHPLHVIKGKCHSKALIAPQTNIPDCLAIAKCYGWVFQDEKRQTTWLLYDYFLWPCTDKGEHIGYE